MIMKKIILLTVVSFVAIIARAQSFHYYPLKEVHDTINYLKLNFDKQGDYFVGRTFDEFWQIIRRDITPTKCNPRGTSPYIDPHGIMWLQGAYMYEALLDASPMLHAFADKNTKPIPYRDEPYDIFGEQDTKRRMIQKNNEKAKNELEAWMISVNKKRGG